MYDEKKETRVFEEWVEHEGLLASWFDGHISSQELLDRLVHIKWNVPGRIERDRQDAFERDEP